MTLSFPYTGSLTALVFVCWIPLLFVEYNISSSGYRSGKVFIHAYLTFFIFNIGTTWWICNASAAGAVLAFTLNALLMALAFQCYHIINKVLGRTYSLLALLCVWIGFEFLHHRWELSWPWLSFGNFFSIRTTWIQWYSYTGMLGGSVWVLLVNYLGLKSIVFFTEKISFTSKSRLYIGLYVSFIFIPLMVSLTLYYSCRTTIDTTEVVIVQPNIDPYNEKFSTPIGTQLKKLFAQAKKKVTPHTKIIIAPETALSSSFFEEELHQHSFYSFLIKQLREWKTTALYTGASTARYFDKRNSRASVKLPDGPGFIEFYNSSLVIEEDGTHEFLHKSKLVLGVEKIPFSDWLPFLEKLSINNGGTSGTLGVEKEAKTLTSKDLTFAPLICYESIYGDFTALQCRKGAQAIFVITNDGWWGDTPGYKQHMSFSRLRAIENRRDVARSANTGISCFINQRGDLIQATKWWQSDAIRAKLNLNSSLSFYSRTGDLIGKIFLYLGITLTLITLYRSLKGTLYGAPHP
jgi:apolipoprotein N-acyltransferase